jgi:glycerol kinase
MYFVPAFSGLFAPYWRGDARGVAVGLTQYVTKGNSFLIRCSEKLIFLPAHFLRAIVEASAFQTYDMIRVGVLDTLHSMIHFFFPDSLILQGNDSKSLH